MDAKPHKRLESEKALLIGLNALALEVPSPVWDDIYERATAYVKEANGLLEQLEAAQARIAYLEQSWHDSASMATYTSKVSDPASEPHDA